MSEETPSSFAHLVLDERAMSIANAMSVRSAGRNAVSDARSVKVTCVESERRSAMNATPVAAILVSAPRCLYKE